MSNLAVLGLQWGDEGKGKIIDLLSEHYDIIVRCQGGNNAGHTVQVGKQVFILTLVPSGVLRADKVAVIGNGVVINPEALLEEIKTLKDLGIELEDNLLISNRAHVVFPYHPRQENATEQSQGNRKIGTTSRGIGPCYEDKMARRGIRVAELIETDIFPERFRTIAAEKDVIAKALGIYEPWNIEAQLLHFQELGKQLRPYVCDTAGFLHQAIKAGKRLLFEGAQATMLDIDFGTYPYLTSSNASAGGLCTGSGVSPREIHDLVGIAKAYSTRVGEGPFITELTGYKGDTLRQAGGEYGTVTGRPRRCGWFDIPMLRYANAINSLSTLVITKLDVLDYLDTIPICTAYKYKGQLIEFMPALAEQYNQVEAVYEELPGWKYPTSDITEYENLPQAATDYIDYLEQKLELEVGGVSIGPERGQTIVRKGSVLEQLISG